MWKQKRSLKSHWCLPRKVVNIYSENKLSIEKIVKSKKKRKIRSSLFTKHNKEIKDVVKNMRQIQRLARPKIKKFLKQNWNSNISENMKKRTLPSKASKRVMELALPKKLTSLKKVSKDLRDPFKVNPSALKAICSTRTKQLAKPRNLNNFFIRSRDNINL